MKGSSLADEEEVVHNYMVSKPCEGHYIPFHFIRSLEKYQFKILFDICQNAKLLNCFIFIIQAIVF